MTVCVGNLVRNKPIDLINIRSILDDIQSEADDEGGEFAEGFTDVGKDAVSELEQLLVGWIEKHCTINFYRVVNVREYMLTDEDM